MESIVDKLKMERNRTSTKDNYYGIWKSFNTFFLKLDRKPDTWEERLNLFVAYLVETNKKSQTIKSYVSAIKAVLRQDDIELNENRYLLNSLIRACKLQNDQVRTRLPIKRNLLGLILDKTPEVFADQHSYTTTMYKALFVTAYYGMFRVGELTQSQHVLKAKDVHIGINKKKLMFILHSSKTHGRDSKPQVIKINGLEYDAVGGRKVSRNVPSSKHCPFTILKAYVQARKGRKSDEEQFFVFSDRQVVTQENFRESLRSVLTFLGLQASLYAPHSMRSGNAVQMVETEGISVETVRKLGRWQSNAVYRYLNN